jgi:integrase
MARRQLEPGEHGEVETTPQRRVDGLWRKAEKVRQAERWRARVQVRDHNGERNAVQRYGDTKREAEQRLMGAVEERLSTGGMDLLASTPLVAAGRLWLVEIKRTDSGLAHGTVKTYEDTFDRIIDVKGATLRGLTLTQANNVQRLRSFLQIVADIHGSGTARTTKTVLSNILEFAMVSGSLPMNAARHLRPVKAQVERDSQRDRTRALTREERDRVLALADKLATDAALDPRTLRKREAIADLIALMAGTGARIGEARGIRWDHVDLDAGFVRLHGTKSASARRRLDLPQWLVERLRSRIERAQGQYLHAVQHAKRSESETRAEAVLRLTAAAQAIGKTGFVFPAPSSLDAERPWDQSNSSAAVRMVLDAAGLKWAVPHSFRRSVATWLGEAGVPLAQIADQLGHADPAMTASVYLGRDFEGDKSALAAHL